MTLDDDIRQSLTDRKDVLDKKLASRASSILKQSIQFLPSQKPYASVENTLKSKYIHISGQQSSETKTETEIRPNSVKSNGHSVQPSTSSVCSHNVVGLVTTKIKPCGPQVPQPQFEIYPTNCIRVTWDERFRIGANVGLHNLGNTCFLNSVIQVLTNTAPLVNYLFSGHHEKSACPKGTGFCGICKLRNHINRVHSSPKFGTPIIPPQEIVNSLRFFMKSHVQGRQEDAHEFLRYFVDTLQTAALYQWKDRKLDLFTKETSPISRIFGGFHKNEIICNNCHSISTTFDPFLDLSLEIKQFDSVEGALGHFTRVETLSSENAYKCPKCNLKVSARKMFTIYESPNVLTIQLKRFDHFGKIDRYIKFNDKLNLRPFMSEKQGTPVNYKLYGVVVHSGRTMNSGHYYAYVKNSLEQWHIMDDGRVSPVAPRNVFTASAYILFYIRVPLQIAAVKPQAVVSLLAPTVTVLKPAILSKPTPVVIKTPPVQPVAPLPNNVRRSTVNVTAPVQVPVVVSVASVSSLPQVVNETKEVSKISNDTSSIVQNSGQSTEDASSNDDSDKVTSRKRRHSSSSSKHSKKSKKEKKHHKKHRRHHKKDRSPSPPADDKLSKLNNKRRKDKDLLKEKKRKRSKLLKHKINGNSEDGLLPPPKLMVKEENEKPIARTVEKTLFSAAVVTPAAAKPSLMSPLEFLKLHGGSGYGSAVKSWTGDVNSIDRKQNGSAINSDRIDDDWNEEFDRGKTKKVKDYNVPFNRSKITFKINRFQQFQNSKNFRGIK